MYGGRDRMLIRSEKTTERFRMIAGPVMAIRNMPHWQVSDRWVVFIVIMTKWWWGTIWNYLEVWAIVKQTIRNRDEKFIWH